MKTARLKAALLLIPGVSLLLAILVFSLPPYAPQSYIWWAMKRKDFISTDREFVASGQQEWQDARLRVAPIYISDDGRMRVYFVGSVIRFGRQYEIAYVSGKQTDPRCKPVVFYSEQPLECSLPLGAGWTVYFSSIF